MHIHEKIGIYFAMGRFFFSEVSKATCFEQSAEFEGEGLRGEAVRIDVDAGTGAQRRISVEL